MHQFVTEPTRQNSILDLIFSDERQLVRDIKIREGLGNSDHNMIQFNISTDCRPKDNLLLVPNFNKANFGNIRNELAEIDWNQKLLGLDAIEAWKVFKDKVQNVQKRHIPFRCKRSRIAKKPVWLTSRIKCKMFRRGLLAIKEAG